MILNVSKINHIDKNKSYLIVFILILAFTSCVNNAFLPESYELYQNKPGGGSGGSDVELPTEPVATNLTILGNLIVGETVSAGYDFYDANNNNEAGSIVSWHISSTIDGTYSIIKSGTLKDYILKPEDENKYIKFSIQPKTSIEPTTGDTVELSNPQLIIPKLGTSPVVTDVEILGDAVVDVTLEVSYTYSDDDGDLEGNTLFAWYICDDSSGTNPQEVATSSTYTVTNSDLGKFIYVTVTPVSLTGGSKQGSDVSSTISTRIVPPTGSAPVASSVSIDSSNQPNFLAGTYTFSDSDGDLEGTSTFRWLRSSDGVTYLPISGATSVNYTLVEEDENQYIVFEVTPVSATGVPVTGTVEKSDSIKAEVGFPLLKNEINGVEVSGIVDFGERNVNNESETIEFTINNVGSGDLTDLVISIGTGTEHFTVSTGISSTTIIGGSNATFSITFNPLSIGYEERVITVTSNELDDYTFTVSGTGTGIVTSITGYQDTMSGSLVFRGSWSDSSWNSAGEIEMSGGGSIWSIETTEIPSGTWEGKLFYVHNGEHWQSTATVKINGVASYCSGNITFSAGDTIEISDITWE